MSASHVLELLVAFGVGYGFALFFLLESFPAKAPTPVKDVKHRLCSFHATYLRPGQVALLDSNNCSKCKKQNDWLEGA